MQGVGEAIASRPGDVPKILMLNGSHDRETAGMSGICPACAHVLTSPCMTTCMSPCTCPRTCSCPCTCPWTGALDVVHAIARSLHQSRGDTSALDVSQYVNLLIVPRDGAFVLDETALSKLGIRIVEVASERDSKGRLIYATRPVLDALAFYAKRAFGHREIRRE